MLRLISRLRVRGSLAIFFFFGCSQVDYRLDFLTSDTKRNGDFEKYMVMVVLISMSFLNNAQV